MRLPNMPFIGILLFACSAPTFAEHSAPQDLRQQMTPAEFKAAGLDKLSTAELAALNDWLQVRTGQTTQIARKLSELESRREAAAQPGFSDASVREPIQSTLVGEFNGFGKGKRFVLANGQEWVQTEAASPYGQRLQAPKVRIKPGVASVWYLQIDRYNAQVKVRRIK